MKAVVYRGPHKMVVEDVDKPRISEPTDAILKVTSTAICGSDLHMYDGRTTIETGTIFGHEIMGVIDQVGDSVKQIKVGDRVVLPFNIGCGDCFNCTHDFTSACLVANPENAGAAYGYAGMGPYQGGQCEYVRVPWVDFNALKVPGMPGDGLEDNFVLLADIFPTAYHATELAGVSIGKSVAIYGAGPVGLLAAMSCQVKGASEVYVVDSVPERLDKVARIGATPINFQDGDPAEQIKDRRKHNMKIQQSLRPGEEKMPGVMCGIDAVGYQAHDIDNPHREKSTAVVEELVSLVNPTGQLGIIGVYMPQDPGGKTPEAKHGDYTLPWGMIFEKGLKVGTGQAPVKRYNAQLRDLILTGKANPDLIVSHHLPLEAAPDAYDKFDKRADGYTKVILKPELSA